MNDEKTEFQHRFMLTVWIIYRRHLCKNTFRNTDHVKNPLKLSHTRTVCMHACMCVYRKLLDHGRKFIRIQDIMHLYWICESVSGAGYILWSRNTAVARHNTVEYTAIRFPERKRSSAIDKFSGHRPRDAYNTTCYIYICINVRVVHKMERSGR